ncbi:MAG: PAS domain S-box protein, partial [Nitrospinae bacterium]|nr:PAS domain S-box protein [Nitrospinota bacterium]
MGISHKERPKMNVALTEIQEFKFKQPLSLLFFTMVVTAGPYALNQIGYDFSSPRVPFHGEGAAGMSPMEIIDSMFRTLSGAFIHTILEWCAFSTAFFTIILSLAHYAIKRDASTPILGVALFCAGGLDAFHILAADRLVTAVADSRTLLPFTWAVSRLFNAMILIVGIRLLLSGAYKDLQRSLLFVIFVSITFGLIAYGIIYICATSPILPDTMFPDSWITRPWDIGPLLLYLFAGVYLIPSFYRQEKNFISYSILISVLPHIATQMHMAFGSSSLFDNHFNIAHFLKIFAYLIPFIGLVLEYVKTYQDQRASEVQTRTIIDTAQEAMIVIDQKGVVRVFNRFAEKMFGYSAGEVLGRNVNLLMPEPYSSEHDEYLSKYLQTGQKNIIETIRELEACRKDNTVFSIELGVNEMTLGKHKYFVGCIRDISERKTAEKKLLKAKQSAELAQEEAERANLSKSRFLANMSHEIRTPMNAILGYSQILLKRKDLDSEQLKAIQTIDSSGKNLLDMINEVLD